MRLQSAVAARTSPSVAPIRVGLAVDFDQLPGFDPAARGSLVQVHALEPPAPVADHREDRVGEQVHGEAALRAHHAEGIDQERHVVGDDHDDGVRGRKPVALRVRVEHADDRLAARTRHPEAQLRKRRAGEILGRALDQVELGHAVEEAANQPVRGHRQALAGGAARSGGDAVDDGLSGGGNTA
jgi:hypothetical protein